MEASLTFDLPPAAVEEVTPPAAAEEVAPPAAAPP